jgi:hypothetical protein
MDLWSFLGGMFLLGFPEYYRSQVVDSMCLEEYGFTLWPLPTYQDG